MESYITNKPNRNVVQLSVFCLPEQKQLIEKQAEEENRSISNFCINIILKKLKETRE